MNFPITAAGSAGWLALFAFPLAAQSPVDLSTWSSESYDVSSFSDGMWTPVTGGFSVDQTVNGDPTMHVGDFDVVNSVIEGKIEVTAAAGDNDYVGFAIGFEPGDSLDPAADYLLIDWKQGTQSFNFGAPSCTPSSQALVGLAVSRVFGLPTGDELWGHENVDAVCSDLASGVTELQRGTTLGSTGWTANVEYTFRFEYDGSTLRVFVNNVLELDVSGNFPSGRLAFYNFSQSGVRYSAFTYSCPAALSTFGAGWPGTNGTPAFGLDAAPVLGTTPMLTFGNSSGIPTDAFVFQARNTGSADIGYGGTLLLAAPLFLRDVIRPMPVGGATIPVAIPNDPALCAADFYLQGFVIDPGASHGVAFTPAIKGTVGE